MRKRHLSNEQWTTAWRIVCVSLWCVYYTYTAIPRYSYGIFGLTSYMVRGALFLKSLENETREKKEEEVEDGGVWNLVRAPSTEWHRTKSEWTMAFADGIIIEMVDDAMHDPHIIGSYRWSSARAKKIELTHILATFATHRMLPPRIG